MAEPGSNRIAPLLRLLADSLETRTGGDGTAGAVIRELGQLARLRIPIRGVLPLSDDQMFDDVDEIAIRYLDLAAIRENLDAALRGVEPFATREEIEVGVDHLSSVLNVAYFNAGLAFGITLADLERL